MSLLISDAEVRATGLTEAELRLELSVTLFQSGRLTLARASRLGGLGRIDFQRVLASRKIPVHYTQEELDEDIRALAGLGPA